MTSEDTTVNIKGTFSVKQREHNGLNRVADLMNSDRLVRVPVVGYVVFHKHTETTQGDTLTVSLEAVEPTIEADGKDPLGAGKRTFEMLDNMRRLAGKSNVADTLFVNAPSPELDGQLEAITRGDVAEPVKDGGKPTELSEAAVAKTFPREAGETNASGDPVPEASGEEIMAERAEARAAATKGSADRTAAAAARPDVARALGVTAEQGAANLKGNLTAVAGKAEGQEDDVVTALDDPKPARTPRGTRKRPAATDSPFTPPGGGAA